MKKIKISLVILLFLSILVYSQEESEFTYEKTIIKPGIGFEYLIRTLKDGNNEISTLKAYIVSFRGETELSDIIEMNFWAGGVFSKYDEMYFRHLPFSLKLSEEESGNLYGLIFGGEINLIIKEFENLEFDLLGRVDYCLGLKKEWEINVLNVPGKADGKPYWIRGISGPLIQYNGFDALKPYGSIVIDYIWGKFNMKEKIENLSGSENKKFHSETLLGILFGNKFYFTETFSAKIEAIIYPAKKNLYISTGISYSF